MPVNQFSEFAQQGQNPQQKNMEVYAQSLAQQHRVALNNTSSPQGLTSGVQGSPMAHPGLDGQENMFAGNGPRNGMPPQAPGAPQQGNHALQDYQMQLMLLEQQNKKRLLMARQEQDNMSGPHQQGAGGAPGFATAMSPNRAGPSPNPTDMKGRTPKLGQQVLPGSPMPDVMQQQRGSPAPNMPFDPNQVPPGMPPQFYPQMAGNPMMRPPPSSHPGANFGNQHVTPQQLDAMRGQIPNGAWRGPPQPQMMPGQPGIGGPIGQNPQQRQQMPPPPAPTNEQPRPEPSPSQSNQAPPTPSQTNKANPKKKPTKDNKVFICATLELMSIVDIDIRSPPTRKVPMQVRHQQLLMVTNLRHQPRRLLWRLSHRSTNSLSRTGSHNNLCSRNPPPNSSLWITAVLHLVTLILT